MGVSFRLSQIPVWRCDPVLCFVCIYLPPAKTHDPSLSDAQFETVILVDNHLRCRALQRKPRPGMQATWNGLYIVGMVYPMLPSYTTPLALSLDSWIPGLSGLKMMVPTYWFRGGLIGFRNP
jgi:hypothetical protein